MSENVKPALTAKEWRYVALWQAGKAIAGNVRGKINRSWSAEMKHATAAQCLYGEDFGFTREDVAFLREMIGSEWDRLDKAEYDAMEARMERHIAKIAALLPPDVDNAVDKTLTRE